MSWRIARQVPGIVKIYETTFHPRYGGDTLNYRIFLGEDCLIDKVSLLRSITYSMLRRPVWNRKI